MKLHGTFRLFCLSSINVRPVIYSTRYGIQFSHKKRDRERERESLRFSIVYKILVGGEKSIRDTRTTILLATGRSFVSWNKASNQAKRIGIISGRESRPDGTFLFFIICQRRNLICTFVPLRAFARNKRFSRSKFFIRRSRIGECAKRAMKN